MPSIQLDDPTQRARLPHPLTPFVGRRRELAELRELLVRSRLLTLTGVGGSGKTRLAIECATTLETEFSSVCWVELAGLSDAAALSHHVAGILAIRESASATTTAAIVEHLRDTQLLLVLDNCEHVVDECALMVEALLRGCPRISILATSREAFGIGGERAWLVPPLSLPDRATGVSLAEAELAEAIQLFVERAASASSGFALTMDNVEAVVRICRRVDGIPLAIELAAARVKVLAPREIADRLEQSFGLLAAGGRTTVPRHRTLRETIDWSYALLTPAEQTLLRRLSVIAGGFRLESVEDICAGDALPAEDIIDTLASLVDKSLVVVQRAPTFTRYRLLETVRQYAQEKLEASGEREALRARHVEHFLALAEKAAPHLIGGAGVPYWMDRLLEDADDLRVVAEWAEESRDRVAVTLRMGAAVQWMLFARGWFQEGRDRLTHALSIADEVDPYTRAVGATALAALCLWQGDTAQLSGLIEPVLPILRNAPERSTYAYALGMLGGAISQEGDPVAAEPVLAQAVDAARRQPHPVLLAIALYWRGMSARSRGEFELARASFEEAVAIGRTQNNLPSIAHPLTALARVLVQRGQPGDLANAEAMLNEALALHRSNGDRWGLAWVLETLGSISSQAHEAERVTRLLAGGETLREVMGAPRPPAERAEIAAMLDDARTALSPNRFETIWNEVRAWPLDSVLDYACSHGDTAASTGQAPGSADAAAEAQFSEDLDVRALGPVRVICSGAELDVKRLPSKVRELLVFLLCHPEGVTREQVGLALWPDASSTQLRNSFHVTMHCLRKGLPDPTWIEAVGERYRVLPALQVSFDARDFERTVSSSLRAMRGGKPGDAPLRQMIALYRGDFMAGEKIGDWHLQQCDHLQRLYRDALRTLAAHDLSLGHHDDAAALYQRLLAVDELDEEAWRGLISCSILAGDRSGAHRLFDRLRNRLRDELDADPEPETLALMRGTQISL